MYYDLSLFDVRTGLSTNGRRTFSLPVKNGKPFRLTLVWTDKEGCADNPTTCPATAPKLVNDLDLVVFSPSNQQYNGNDISAPFKDQWDRRNNVERMEVVAPQPGYWTVEVRGFTIPFGPQDFALVASYDNLNINPIPIVPPLVTVHSSAEQKQLLGTYLSPRILPLEVIYFKMILKFWLKSYKVHLYFSNFP